MFSLYYLFLITVRMSNNIFCVCILLSVRTALLAIIGFMPTHGSGAIGSLDYTPAERKVYAKKLVHFVLTPSYALIS